MRTKDSIWVEIEELRKDLASMNPKLSCYATTMKKYQELAKIVGANEQIKLPPNKKLRAGHRY